MAIEEKINNKENNNKKKQTTILNFIESPKIKTTIKTPKKQQPGSPGLGKVMKTTSTKKKTPEKWKRKNVKKQLNSCRDSGLILRKNNNSDRRVNQRKVVTTL